MNLLDAALAAVALVSVLAGAFRGFVRETVALTGWIVAAVLVLNASTGLGQRLPFDPGSTGARTAIAAILIVVLCTLCAALVGRILRAAMAAAHLGGPDRALGALFGLVRAVAISLVVAVVVIHFGMSQRPFWKSSRLAPWLEAALRLASPGLAPSVLWPAPAPGA
jgi:membrane protein required for colicin V production